MPRIATREPIFVWHEPLRTEVARLEIELGAAMEFFKPKVLKYASDFGRGGQTFRPIVRNEGLLFARIDECEAKLKAIVLGRLHVLHTHRGVSIAGNSFFSV